MAHGLALAMRGRLKAVSENRVNQVNCARRLAAVWNLLEESSVLISGLSCAA